MNFLETFLPKMYVTLIPTSEGIELSGELRKNSKVLKRYEKELFEQSSALTQRVQKLRKESSLTYVSLLETEMPHGVLLERSELDLSSIDRIKVENKFELYISKDDLHERQKQFKSIGLDLLFSPFSLLYSVYEARLAGNDGLYLLLDNESITSAIIKDATIIFTNQTFLQERLDLLDESKVLEVYVENIQQAVKAFYESKVDERMFIEKVFIADAVGFDTALENRLEEVLFVEVHKQNLDRSHELAILSEKELV